MRVLSSEGLSATIASIKDGATVAISGAGGGLLEPEAIFQHFETSFLRDGAPRNLTLVHALGMGNRVDTGTNRFAYEGLVKRVIGGHWIWSPRMLRAFAKEQDRGLLPPERRDHEFVPRDRRKAPGFFHACWFGNVRRSPTWRRPLQ